MATVQRISKIISSLKFLVRDSAKEGVEQVSLKFLLDETLALCSYKLDQSHVKLIIEPYADHDVNCRDVQISLVLVNLIRNAIDTIEKLPEKWIRIAISTEQNLVRISVMDSGAGIPAEVIEKCSFLFTQQKV